MKNIFTILIVFIVFLFAWEAFSGINQNYIFILPSPSQVLVRLWEKLDRFWFHTQITLKEMIFGSLFAFCMAFPLAWMMDAYNSASRILQPLFIVIQCIPMFTLAPIMIIWFGWSFAAIVVPTAIMIFFPLTISIYQGLRATSQDLLDFFKVHQATSWQIFYKLKLPGALSHIFSGFRLSTAIAGVAAVAGEWAGAQSGLGILMLESRRDLDLETNFAALFCLTVISSMLYLGAILCEYMVTQRHLVAKFLKNDNVKTALTSCLLLIFCLLIPSFFSPTIKKEQQITITLDWLPNVNHVPLYVGIKKGFFSDERIYLTIKKLQDSGSAASYLTSGQSDLAVNYMSNTLRIMQKGAKVTPIGILIQEPLNAIIYRNDAGIKTPKDLMGKILGFSTTGKDCVFLDTFLAHNGIYPAERRNLCFDLIPFLGNKLVNAVYGAYWNIEIEHLRSLGIEVNFFKLEEFGIPTHYELIILAKNDSPEVQPDFIKRFQNGLQTSIDYSKQYPEEAFQIYLEMQQDKSLKTSEWEWKAWQQTLPVLADQQQISQEVWNNFADWLKTNQLL